MANALRGQVTAKDDGKGNLTLQLPTVYSKRYYNVKQKYISFGSKNTPENVIDAMTSALKLQSDIESGEFDPSEIVKYLHSSKNSENYSQSDTNVVDLFTRFTNQLKVHESTLGCYKVFLSHLNKMYEQCGYTLKQQLEISKWVQDNVASTRAVRLLAALDRMVKWGVKESKLPENFPNKFHQYELELKKSLKNVNTKRKPPALVSHIPREYDDIQAWSEGERDIIIKGFHERKMQRRFKEKIDYLAYLIEFLFHTGCRHGEAFALTWQDVKSDFTSFDVNKSYCSKIKKIKGTKTGKNRRVPANSRVQEILKTIKPENINLDSLIFTNRMGNTFSSDSLARYWTPKYIDGTEKVSEKSVIIGLINKGKLTKYIESYSTRRTFVSIQINKGIPVTTVAKWVGDNPETILKHYARHDDDAVPY